MATKGRPAIPTNLHVLRNNPGHKTLAQLADRGFTPLTEIPPCPEWLPPDGKAEWNRIAIHLKKHGLVSQFDLSALTAYCAAWADLAWCEKQLASGKKRIALTSAGTDSVSAISRLKYTAMDTLRRFATEFGMTPSSRVNLSGNPAKPEDGEPGAAPREGWGGFA